MFYNRNNSMIRRLQRLQQAGIKTADQKGFVDIFDEIFDQPNHHFNCIGTFTEFSQDERIQYIELRNLTEFIFTKTNMKLSKSNVAKNYAYSEDDLDEYCLDKLKRYYKRDFDLL